MAKVAVYAKLKVLTGRADEAIDLLVRLITIAEQEPRTEVFAMHRARDELDTVWFYELHADEEALQLMDRLADDSIGAELEALLVGPPEVIVSDPVFAKGIAF